MVPSMADVSTVVPAWLAVMQCTALWCAVGKLRYARAECASKSLMRPSVSPEMTRPAVDVDGRVQHTETTGDECDWPESVSLSLRNCSDCKERPCRYTCVSGSLPFATSWSTTHHLGACDSAGLTLDWRLDVWPDLSRWRRKWSCPVRAISGVGPEYRCGSLPDFRTLGVGAAVGKRDCHSCLSPTIINSRSTPLCIRTAAAHRLGRWY